MTNIKLICSAFSGFSSAHLRGNDEFRHGRHFLAVRAAIAAGLPRSFEAPCRREVPQHPGNAPDMSGAIPE
jgi:hypothetical protein